MSDESAAPAVEKEAAAAPAAKPVNVDTAIGAVSDSQPGVKGTGLPGGLQGIEGDDGLLRSPLCVAFSECPDGVPANFWNKNHRYVDIGAMGQSWKDTRSELDRMRQEFRAPDEYKLTDSAVGFFGQGTDPDKMEEAASAHPIVQRLAAEAKAGKWSQKQFAKALDVFLDVTVGEGFRQAEEARYIQMNGGDELRAGQRVAAIQTHNNAALSDEKLAVHRGIVTQLMRTADGRAFLESVYGGQFDPYIRSRVSRADVSAAHEKAVSDADLRKLMATKEYQRGDVVMRKRVSDGFAKLYGDQEYVGGR